MATARKPKKTPPARPAAKKEKPAAPLGRYLRRFTLQNVRTFRSPVTLDFCREDGSVAQWTVILGENGTGKTTLLQYLAGMMPTDFVDTEDQSEPETKWVGPALAGGGWENFHLFNLPKFLNAGFELTAKLQASNLASSLRAHEVWPNTSEEIDLKWAFHQVGLNYRHRTNGSWTPREPLI